MRVTSCKIPACRKISVKKNPSVLPKPDCCNI